MRERKKIEIHAFIEDVLANPPGGARVEDVRSSSVPVTSLCGFSIVPTLR
jgi:hypothetical protein